MIEMVVEFKLGFVLHIFEISMDVITSGLYNIFRWIRKNLTLNQKRKLFQKVFSEFEDTYQTQFQISLAIIFLKLIEQANHYIIFDSRKAYFSKLTKMNEDLPVIESLKQLYKTVYKYFNEYTSEIFSTLPHTLDNYYISTMNTQFGEEVYDRFVESGPLSSLSDIIQLFTRSDQLDDRHNMFYINNTIS